MPPERALSILRAESSGGRLCAESVEAVAQVVADGVVEPKA
jgi:hypothetical protein